MVKFIFALIIGVLAITGCTKAQYPNFHKELRDYFPTKVGKSNFTLDNARDLLYKKCKKVLLNGTTPPEDQYKNLEKAAHKLIDCVNSIGNVTLVMEEIEAASPTGDLDVVLGKYCMKMPLAKQCIAEFNDQLVMCLTPRERSQNSIMMRIVDSLLDFACHRNGEAIALFIAEDGPKCLEDNKDNIAKCMNATLSAYIPETVPSELPELVMGPQQCIDMRAFEDCLLHYMETCNEVTPAGLVESLFRYIRKETVCQAELDKVKTATEKARSAASCPVLRFIYIWLLMFASVLRDVFK
ncbi:27 kDa hemolymph protein-like [Musca autumnalis]|uniref:27 kDa hemolymph protein-like n=1 Tax=Musca autumnalis TaxID=221902 RepID=UPI003CF06C17